jgi:hypothetical protein
VASDFHGIMRPSVERFAYLRCPSKIRVAIINEGGPRLSLQTIERKLAGMPRRITRVDVGEPIESDGEDYRVAGLVKVEKSPRTRKPRNRQNLARVKQAAQAAATTTASGLRYTRSRPDVGSTPFSDALIEEVCEALAVPQDLLLGPSRWWKLAAVRSLIVVLLRERGEAIYSYPRIARILGRTCHTTIVHSYQRFEHYCAIYPDVAALYLEMREPGK